MVLSSSATCDSFLHPFETRILPNGLTVVVKEVHATPIVAVYFWVGVGAGDEPAELNGISHFFEHMFFKGTERRGVGEMDRLIKGLGGRNNAFTSYDYTGYYVVLPREDFATAADVLVDALRNSVFDPVELGRERKVVEEEIHRSEDIPEEKVQRELLKTVFRRTPYARPILGTPEVLERMDQMTFKRHLGEHYVPGNITAVVVGDVNTEEAIQELERLTETWESETSGRAAATRIPVIREWAEKRIVRDVNQSYLHVAFRHTGWQNLAEAYAFEMAAAVLGQGRSSRLYQRLVEEEVLAVSVDAWTWDFRGTGLFGVAAVCTPKNLIRVENEVVEEILRLGEEVVPAAELDKARTILKSDFAFSTETNDGKAGTLGWFAVMGDVQDAARHVDRLDAVRAEDIRSAFQKYGGEGGLVICAVGPEIAREESR